MKNSVLLILCIASLALLTNSCKKEPPVPTVIPMRATMDGKAYKFESPRGYWKTDNDTYNVQSNRHIYDLRLTTPEIEILDIPDTAMAGDVFPIVEYGWPELYASTEDGGLYFSSAGTLRIVSHDISNKTMEVTFSCTLSNIFDPTITIPLTNGSATFDYKDNFPQ